jgi:ankyrin repeat protein
LSLSYSGDELKWRLNGRGVRLDFILVEKLVNSGIDINLKDNNGDTLLMVTVMLDVTTKEIDKESSKKSKSVKYNRVNNLDLISKQKRIIKLLLERNADVCIKNKYDYDILRIIKDKSDYYEIRKIFNKYGYFEDEEFESNNTEKNENFIPHIEKEIIINKLINGISPLYKAIVDNDVELVKKLLNSGADIYLKNSDDYSIMIKHYADKWYEYKSKTPLYGALDSNNLNIMRLITFEEKDIANLLEYAIREEKIDIAIYLIEQSKNLNEKIPLKVACQEQNFKIIRALIEHDININGVDINGQSALFDAIEAKKANIDIIKFLLDKGADINQEDNKGITPLSFAQSNKKSLVKVLTVPQEKKIIKKQIPDKTIEYQDLSKKITAQNKLINDFKKEMEFFKKNTNQNDFINELKNHIETQAKKIYTLENERLSREVETQKIISELLTKIETLAKNISKRSKIKNSSSIPRDITIEQKSLQKDDGVIVKRESFDDF